MIAYLNNFRSICRERPPGCKSPKFPFTYIKLKLSQRKNSVEKRSSMIQIFKINKTHPAVYVIINALQKARWVSASLVCAPNVRINRVKAGKIREVCIPLASVRLQEIVVGLILTYHERGRIFAYSIVPNKYARFYELLYGINRNRFRRKIHPRKHQQLCHIRHRRRWWRGYPRRFHPFQASK